MPFSMRVVNTAAHSGACLAEELSPGASPQGERGGTSRNADPQRPCERRIPRCISLSFDRHFSRRLGKRFARDAALAKEKLP
jgi:hypothetical protein